MHHTTLVTHAIYALSSASKTFRGDYYLHLNVRKAESTVLFKVENFLASMKLWFICSGFQSITGGLRHNVSCPQSPKLDVEPSTIDRVVINFYSTE